MHQFLSRMLCIIPIILGLLYPPSAKAQVNLPLAIAVIGRTDSAFQYGFIGTDGNWAFNERYTYFPSWQYTYTTYGFSENVANVYMDSCWYFIDRKGQILTKLDNVSFVSTMHHGLALATVHGNWDDRNFIDGFDNWGYIDLSGKIIIPANLRAASDFSDGMACIGVSMVSAGDAYIDKTGTIKIQFNNGDFGTDFQNGIAYINRWDKGYLLKINNSGKILDTVNHPGLFRHYSNGLLTMSYFSENTGYFDSMMGFFDSKGRHKFKFYKKVKPFNTEITGVEIDNKWGFISSKGRLIIKPSYDDVGNFSQGLVAVKLNNKWGYINKKGTLVIPYLFDYVEDFQ
jgi:hypothetical protein